MGNKQSNKTPDVRRRAATIAAIRRADMPYDSYFSDASDFSQKQEEGIRALELRAARASARETRAEMASAMASARAAMLEAARAARKAVAAARWAATLEFVPRRGPAAADEDGAARAEHIPDYDRRVVSLEAALADLDQLFVGPLLALEDVKRALERALKYAIEEEAG